jgi:hypothetical protein
MCVDFAVLGGYAHLPVSEHDPSLPTHEKYYCAFEKFLCGTAFAFVLVPKFSLICLTK